MKLGVYINKNKKNLESILNIILEEFSSKNDEIIYLNEENFISNCRDKYEKLQTYYSWNRAKWV